VATPLPLHLPADRPFDVLGLGQNSVDLVARVPVFPTPNSKLQLTSLARLPGGQVASALVCCARLGWRTRYIGRFGDDDLGALGRGSLVAEGVDVSEARPVTGARTRFAVVLVDQARGEGIAIRASPSRRTNFGRMWSRVRASCWWTPTTLRLPSARLPSRVNRGA
jgi:hypothetical protein